MAGNVMGNSHGNESANGGLAKGEFVGSCCPDDM